MSGDLPQLSAGTRGSFKKNSALQKKIIRIDQIKQHVKGNHEQSPKAEKKAHELLSDESLKRLLANDSLKYEPSIKHLVQEFQAYSQLGFKIITNRRN